MSVRRVFSNGLYQSLSTILGILARLGILAILGRMLGVEGIGVWSIVTVVNSFCISLANMGFKSYSIFAVARNDYKPGELLIKSLPICFVGSLASFLISTTALILLDYSLTVVIGSMIVNASLFFESTSHTVIGIFNGKQRMGKTSILQLLDNALFLVIGLIALVIWKNVIALFVALAVGKTLIMTISLIMFRRSFGPFQTHHFAWKASIKTGREAFPFALENAANMGFNRFDILILSLFWSEAVTGMYNASIVIIFGLNNFIKPFNVSLYPVLTENFKKNRALYHAYLIKGMKYLFCLALPLSVFVYFAAADILTIVYGPDLTQAAPLMQALSFMIVLRILNPLLSNSVTASGNQVWRTKTLIFSFVFNSLLNLALVPLFKGLGSSWASVVTEAVIALSYLGFLIKKDFIKIPLSPLGFMRIMALIATTFAMGWLIREWFFIFQGAAIFVGFSVACFLVGLLTISEIKDLADRILKRKSPKTRPMAQTSTQHDGN